MDVDDMNYWVEGGMLGLTLYVMMYKHMRCMHIIMRINEL